MSRPIYEFSRFARPVESVPHAGAQVVGIEARGEAAAMPVIGVIYNPRSHRNKGQDLEIAVRPNIFVAQPRERSELPAVLADFARRGIEYLVINGGDGTVRDVLTCGQAVFGDNWPKLAVLPKGKTNALNVDLGAPADWSLPEAVEAFASGHIVTRRSLAIAPADSPQDTVQGFILGAGAFTTGTRAGQDAHKLGAFNSLAVAVTIVWGVLQALFGTDNNPWRRGVGMRILLGEERRELPRSRHGRPERRELLVASTLESFPVGIKPFGKLRKGLKLAVMDKPRRRLLAMLPIIASGYMPEWLIDWGIHHCQTSEFELDIEDQFILDGEAFPAGRYRVTQGPELHFVVP
jgi:hypothetical protein